MVKTLSLVFGLGLMMLSFATSAQQFKFEKDTLFMCDNVGTLPHPYPYNVGDNWDSKDMHNSITNLTNDTFVYKWQVILSQTTVPDGWTWYGLCDNYLCRSPFTSWINTGTVE